ncbi:hypothetical protein VE04_07242 [Pseudogymnoascus sp. 24MN13]|nr:hypothetical protein VE04_07242 [Pseudogymnoascus sp. 24MN13]
MKTNSPTLQPPSPTPQIPNPTSTKHTNFKTHAALLQSSKQHLLPHRPHHHVPPSRSPSSVLDADLTALQSLAPARRDRRQREERLEPVDTDDLFKWEAVVKGRGLGGGDEDGRWLLEIEVPEQYPNAPPKVRFRTRVVGSNVDFETGEVCLDLLKDNWSPAYTLEKTVEAVALMLANPGVDSPLNVDVAALVEEW